ncbi:MAG: hypothetical protein KJ626_02440 [Verrucomicrobia bacterium]|nr:hypothetical protein [Verrucomicrobiota bacterium]
MSALAETLLMRGCQVSGSDRFLDQGQNMEVLWKLKRLGARLVPQDGSGIGKWTAGIVVSSAIEEDNPDLVAAHQHEVPVIHRAEMLARLSAGKRIVAIAGTSGKTTVTGMVGWMLEQVSADPTVVNGGAVLNWTSETTLGSSRCGRSDTWVLEADESDRSFLRFAPDWAIITNISKDHFDLEETVSLFGEFLARIRSGVVVGHDVPAVLGEHLSGLSCDVVTAPPLEGVSAGPGRFTFKGTTFTVPLIGMHNLENALHAAVLCECMGYPLDKLRKALSQFGGIARRLEVKGVARGVTVVDEYAHNPAKIRAAWQAVAEKSPCVLGVWRPHGYGPLKLMMNELAAAFVDVCRADDKVFLLPVFYAGGTAEATVSSDDLAEKLKARGVDASVVTDYDILEEILKREAAAGDAILCMGARDPQISEFARRMVKALG